MNHNGTYPIQINAKKRIEKGGETSLCDLVSIDQWAGGGDLVKCIHLLYKNLYIGYQRWVSHWFSIVVVE